MKLPLYSHPCTWVFIDDHARFLRALESTLPRYQPRRMFDKPREALEFLRGHEPVDFLKPESSYDDGELTLRLDLDKLTSRLTDPKRFDEVSVVVCDYAMPGMNGLELLSEIEDRSIKRIMLTGVATEEIAVEAFNAGTIDRYIKKSSSNAIGQLVDLVNEQQRMYLSAKQADLSRYVEENDALVSHPDFEPFFEELVADHKMVEYYYSARPRGFLGLDDRGSSTLVVTANEKDFESLLEQLTSAGADAELLDDVTNKRTYSLIFEPIEEGYLQQYDWETNTCPMRPVPGIPGWWLGIIKDPPLEVDFEPSVASVSAHVQSGA